MSLRAVRLCFKSKEPVESQGLLASGRPYPPKEIKKAPKIGCIFFGTVLCCLLRFDMLRLGLRSEQTKTTECCFCRSECEETRSNVREACPRERYDYVSRERTRRVRRTLGVWTPLTAPEKNKQADHTVCFCLERITGLEPATSTLARWRSTK